MLGGRTDGILSVANLIYKPNLRLQKIRPNIQNIDRAQKPLIG